MAKKTVVKEHEAEPYAGHKGPMKIETPPPPKVPLHRDVQFLREALVKETNRINELELSMESLRQDIKRVMNRMGL